MFRRKARFVYVNDECSSWYNRRFLAPIWDSVLKLVDPFGSRQTSCLTAAELQNWLTLSDIDRYYSTSVQAVFEIKVATYIILNKVAICVISNCMKWFRILRQLNSAICPQPKYGELSLQHSSLLYTCTYYTITADTCSPCTHS